MPSKPSTSALTPGRITFIYALFGSAWILFSDITIGGLTRDPDLLTRLATVKGWGFILVTAVLLFVLTRRLHDDLIRERDFFTAVFETSASPILVLDAARRVVRANPACARLSGFPVDEAVGQPVDLFHLPGEISRVQAAYGQALASATPVTGEFHWLSRDGELCRLVWRLAALRGGGGDRIVAVGTDITDIREMADGLAAEREKLRVTLLSIGDAVVTTDANGRIELLNGAAERLTGWTLGDAVGHHASEVVRLADERDRAPLANPADLILRGDGPADPIPGALLVARNGAEAAVAGSGAPIRDATGRIAGAVLVLRDITLARRFEAETARARRFEAVGRMAGGVAHDFNNLLTAILGGIQMAQTAGPADPESAEGLDDANTAALQARELSQQLMILARGGQVAGDAAPDPVLPPAGGPAPAAALPRPARIARILLMDDQEVIRIAAATLLRRIGHEVETAGDGDEACALHAAALAAGRPYDAVILDLVIPGKPGGDDCLRRLRQSEPGVRAILASGHIDAPMVRDQAAPGFSGVLHKPFTLKELSAALDAALGTPRV